MIIISSANCTLISDTPIIPYLKALTMYNKGFAFETICQVFDNNSNVYKTSNSGLTWSQVTTSGPVYTSGLCYIEGTNTVFSTGVGSSFSPDGGNTWTKDPNNPIPINQTAALEISNVGAQVIGSRIHLWVTDKYDDSEAVGYYLFEPDIEIHGAE